MKKLLPVAALAVVLLGGLWAGSTVLAEEKKQQDAFLLTIFLRHDQSETLGEIDQHLERTGFWKKFPSEGTEVVSWYVMTGIGRVVALRVPPESGCVQ